MINFWSAASALCALVLFALSVQFFVAEPYGDLRTSSRVITLFRWLFGGFFVAAGCSASYLAFLYA